MPRHQPRPLEWFGEVGPILVLDENFAPRLAHELRKRGRRAVGLQRLQLRGVKDAPLLSQLAELPEPWLLVSQDKTMPLQHAAAIAELAPTIAVVLLADDLIGDAVDWACRDIVHRWAHAMQGQAPGSIREYTPGRSAPWRWRERPRVRKASAIAAQGQASL
jgi:PIN like domain